MKVLWQFIRAVLLLITIAVGMLYFFQEKLIFQSDSLPKEFQYIFETNFEELFLEAKDGASLNGLHFKQNESKGVILYNHGNAGQLDDWGHWAQELSNRYQYDVVIWDYRGYGKSTGKRKPHAMLDDGLLFYNYCKAHFTEKEITVFGRSLGGFFATYIAKRKGLRQLILESTPLSLLQIAKNEYPFLPVRLLLKFQFQNHQNLPKINTPTYIIHGTQDNLVPFTHGEKLFELSSAGTKKLFAIKGGHHNDLAQFGAAYFEVLDEILD